MFKNSTLNLESSVMLLPIKFIRISPLTILNIKEVGAMRKNYLSAGCLLFYALFDKHKLLVIDEGLREGVCLASMKNIKF